MRGRLALKLIYEKEYGDVLLYKFVLFKTPMIDGIKKNYDRILKGYLYYWEYTYNTARKTSDDKLFTHIDIRDSAPEEVRKQCKDKIIFGKTDCYMPYKGDPNPVRLWFTGYTDLLTKANKDYLKGMFKADYIK